MRRKRITRQSAGSQWVVKLGDSLILASVAMLFAAYSSPVRSGTLYVDSNTALQGLNAVDGASVVRLGFANPGDGGIGLYVAGSSACALNHGEGDNGYQVPSADGRCWNLAAQAAYDVRQWGMKANPVNLYANPGGNDYFGGSSCLIREDPCETLSQAVSAAHKLDAASGAITINLAAGSYRGSQISGPLRGAGGSGISGQYLWIVGAGSAATNITRFIGQTYSLDISTGAGVALQGVTLPGEGDAQVLFVQNTGTYVTFPPAADVVFTGTAGAYEAIHVEEGAEVEFSGGSTVTIQGSFIQPIGIGETANVAFDPAAEVLSCGNGLTDINGFFYMADNAVASLGPGLKILNCSRTTGPIVTLLRGAVLRNNSGQNVPGDGAVRVDMMSSFHPTPVPNLGACDNGRLIDGSNNYDMEIIFAGPNAGCHIKFGKPSNASSYFSNQPLCSLSLTSSDRRKFANFDGLTNTDISIVPSSDFVKGDGAVVHCRSMDKQ
jgi:hypothetical protein